MLFSAAAFAADRGASRAILPSEPIRYVVSHASGHPVAVAAGTPLSTVIEDLIDMHYSAGCSTARLCQRIGESLK